MATAEMSEQDTRVEDAERDTRPVDAAAEHAGAVEMFQFSAYVNVGPRAEECDEKESCGNPLHFHAWCRLPNKFQHKDIREKGMAAKARRVRAMKDPESDAYAVLDSELSEFTEDRLPDIIAEIVARDWSGDYMRAIEEISSRDEFAQIEQDRERYEEILDEEGAKPEGERSDEFEELHKHVTGYIEAVKSEVERLQDPRRDALIAQGYEAALKTLREQRIDMAGDQTFLHVYNEWMWFIGTLRPNKLARVFSKLGNADDQTPGTMWGAAPEVINAIESTFTDLDRAMQAAVRGNS